MKSPNSANDKYQRPQAVESPVTARNGRASSPASQTPRPVAAGGYDMGTCEFCKYWNRQSRECRRHSPKPGLLGSGEWPRTAPDDYCGEGEKKDDD